MVAFSVQETWICQQQVLHSKLGAALSLELVAVIWAMTFYELNYILYFHSK